MTLFKWSRTAASNAIADPSVNWQEGQSPSSVNDSARAMMASIAKYRDDITGAIVTGGTATAYTVTSYQGFDTLARLDGQIIAFTPHTTNAATVTLNVDSLGPKPLRSSPGTELLAGVLIQGTPYAALYNHADQAWYVQNFYGNPYNIPLAAGMDYWAAATPNSSFAFPVGQAVSRVTYARLFALVGTTYGSGDGSTTFNLPDKRGRVSASLDGMGGSSAGRLTDSISGFGDGLGETGGGQTHTLITGELPAHTHANSLNDPGHFHSFSGNFGGAGQGNVGASAVFAGSTNTATSITGISISNASVGNGLPHNNMQPTIICNYIMRII
jgi:microcystin-dependent protein